MEHTLNDILRVTTEDYLNTLQTPYPEPARVESAVLEKTTAAIINENSIRKSQTSAQKNSKNPGKSTPSGKKPSALGNALRIPTKLDPSQIALILAKIYPICTVCTGGEGSDRSCDLLAVYQDSGDNEGIWVTDEETFRTLAMQYDFTLRNKDFQEILSTLRAIVPRRYRCTDPNLVAVNNGIFDYEHKKLLDFSPDYVFMSKSHVNYVDHAENPVITEPDGSKWDVESWMKTLSDDPDVVNLLWQILGAIIRPLVPWNKSAWFYSESGNNGKGTLCELMRNLIGTGAYASIPLASLGQDFMLEPLTRASAIIVDENDVGTYIDKAANLKAIITNDVIQINRKFKTPIAYQFYGFMVQCLNEIPRIKDKSDSFFRRQLFIPFNKCFTGREKKYIKNDYLKRKDVLEYVMYRVLTKMPDYYQLSEPETCRLAMEEYKEYNDPVRQFADDVLPNLTWNLAPFTMLFAMYKVWFQRNMPSGTLVGKQTFINDLLAILPDYPDWICPDKTQQIRAKHMMDACEPLIGEYQLTEWMNPFFAHNKNATNNDKSTPAPGQFENNRYRGIQRNAPENTENGKEKGNKEEKSS